MKQTEKPIIVKQTYDSTLENVWNAITVHDEIKQWYFSDISTFETKVGFETRFIVKVEDRTFPHFWKVTEIVPFKRIAYSWSYEGYKGSALVTFELFAKADQTELKLTYDVIEDFLDTIPEFKRESGINGWNYFIKDALKKYVDGKRITN